MYWFIMLWSPKIPAPRENGLSYVDMREKLVGMWQHEKYESFVYANGMRNLYKTKEEKAKAWKRAQ